MYFQSLLACILSLAVGGSSKQVCYSGSQLYPAVAMDCSSENSSYTGDWYCSTMEVCEQFINKHRKCVLIKGCSTQQQCTNQQTNQIYSHEPLLPPGANGLFPGGMTTNLHCCKAADFNNDDVVAPAYGDICNTGGLSSAPSILSFLGLIVATIFATFIIL